MYHGMSQTIVAGSTVNCWHMGADAPTAELILMLMNEADTCELLHVSYNPFHWDLHSSTASLLLPQREYLAVLGPIGLPRLTSYPVPVSAYLSTASLSIMLIVHDLHPPAGTSAGRQVLMQPIGCS